MLTIRSVSDEAGFDIMCGVESALCRANAHRGWQPHVGGLCFDRYLFGAGASDLFRYARLLVAGEEAVGYLLAYGEEREFVLRVLPGFEHVMDEALEGVHALMEDGEYSTTANSRDAALCGALLRNEFAMGAEERYQAMLDLAGWTPPACGEGSETISPLTEQDVAERIRYASIPSDSEVTEAMFRELCGSAAYGRMRDYVVRDAQTNAFIGFVTWCTDPESASALLEPVACLPEYRPARDHDARPVLRP